MDFQLKGMTALITGGGQGIGRGIAKVLAGEGVSVIVNDLYAERAEAVATEITKTDRQAIGLAADIGDHDSVKAMITRAVDAFGPIDILVNNAGVPVELREGKLKLSNFVESAPEVWQKVINLNLYGSIYCTHAVLGSMIERKRGKIISIISEAGRMGEPFQAVYSAAKAGILGLTKSIAREVGQHAINVNCVAVGACAHEGTIGRLNPDATPETDTKLAKMLRVYPIGQGLRRIGVPNDIANAVAFLASPKACFITGQCLSVSGGFSMMG